MRHIIHVSQIDRGRVHFVVVQQDDAKEVGSGIQEFTLDMKASAVLFDALAQILLGKI